MAISSRVEERLTTGVDADDWIDASGGNDFLVWDERETICCSGWPRTVCAGGACVNASLLAPLRTSTDPGRGTGVERLDANSSVAAGCFFRSRSTPCAFQSYRLQLHSSGWRR
jgi:hypothetical protein